MSKNAMPRILILFSSHDGHTRRIAERIAAKLLAAGHAVNVRRADAPEAMADIAQHDGVIVGAAIRFGHHARWLERRVQRHVAAISQRPNAFFSVCLSAGGPGAKPKAAQRYLDEFARRSGWQPDRMVSIAGALQYSKYNPFIRFMISFIMRVTGGDRDTSRDYEYTDWKGVDRFAAEFSRRLASARAA